MEGLVPIGEFAAASRLSPKALRLYGEKGLLPPAWVDPGSGYRYYRVQQLRLAMTIGLLRRAGMSLVEIRAFVRDPSPERLDAYERRLSDELAERRRVLHYVKRALEEEPMYDVTTKRVDSQSYVSREKRVRVPELDRFISESFEALGSGQNETPPFVIYHGPVNHEDDGPVEVCVPHPDGERELPAAEVAFTEISGRQCDFPDILAAYEAVYSWVEANRRTASGPPREIHLATASSGLQLEIAVPLA